MLEIGISSDSIRMWTEYFFLGDVWGIDLPANEGKLTRIHDHPGILYMDAAKPPHDILKTIHTQFDVIVEDAGHTLDDQLAIYSVWKWWLKPSGIYVIEDVQDIDASGQSFREVAQEHGKQATIYDRRKVKGRFDDVLVVITDQDP